VYIVFTWPNCHVILNVSVKQILNVQSKLFCGDSHSDAAFHFFARSLECTQLPRPLGSMRCPDQLGSVGRGVGLEMGIR
jgi:hypothetical protein